MLNPACLLLMSAAAVQGTVQPGSAHPLLDKVTARYQPVSTIEGDFTQTTCLKPSGTCQQFSGRFFVKRLNQFRLEVIKPESQLIVSDGTILWTYIKSAKNAYKSDVARSQTVFSPFELLLNYPSRYDTQLLPNEDNLNLVRLVPKTQNSLISDIRLCIDPASFSIVRIKIIDALDNEMVFSLDRVRYNRPLSDDFFTFAPPPGVKVLTTTPGLN